MELRHIRYFLAVTKEMNFTRAAENLCIAQPPLSRQIKDLEEELGVRLFIRKKHSLQLTEEGELFKQYAAQVLDLVEKSTSEIREMKQGLQGMLTLGSVEGSAPRILADWISDFSKQNPHVQYSLWNGNSDDVANRVLNGLCDLAVIMEPHNGEGLNSIPIYQESWVALIPKDNPLAKIKSKTIPLEEIAKYDLIIPSRSSRLEEINSWFENSDVKPHVRCRIAHLLSAYEFTRKGIGIAIYPAAAKDIELLGDVCIKELRNPSPKASYILIWNKYKTPSHIAEAFISYVKGTLL